MCFLALGPGALPGYGVGGFLPSSEEGGSAGHGGLKADDGQAAALLAMLPPPSLPSLVLRAKGIRRGWGPSDWTRFVLGVSGPGGCAWSPSLMLSIVGLSEEFGVSSFSGVGLWGNDILGVTRMNGQWAKNKEPGG